MAQNESIVKVFGIIEYLMRCNEPVGIRKLANDLRMDSATAYRFLQTLKGLGYVRQYQDNHGYQLTLKFSWISSFLLDRVHLGKVAHPYLQHLADLTNETTHLLVLDGDEFVYIDKVDSRQAMQMRSRVGMRGYLYSTAGGKAIMAHLPDKIQEKIIGRLNLIPLTRNTITDIVTLKNQLSLIRSREYAIDDEENEVGIRCIGAPIRNDTGVIGAISLSGWIITMTPEKLPQLAVEVKAIGLEISKELGYRV
jgi:IclR family transcriptional regulator, KDG regulon repressor